MEKMSRWMIILQMLMLSGLIERHPMVTHSYEECTAEPCCVVASHRKHTRCIRRARGDTGPGLRLVEQLILRGVQAIRGALLVAIIPVVADRATSVAYPCRHQARIYGLWLTPDLQPQFICLTRLVLQDRL